MNLSMIKPATACIVVVAIWAAGPSFATEAPGKQVSPAAATPSAPRATPPAPASGSRELTGVWARYPQPWPTFTADFDDVPPPDQGPDLDEPYATEWREKRMKRNEALKAGKPLIDPSTLCRPEGMPGMMQAIYPIEILQTPGQITILAELFAQTRRIYMDAPMPPVDEIPPSYNGFSTASWEGDALVVKTQGIRKDVEFFEIPHSEAMRITERYQVAANGKLYLDISIEDPGHLRTPYEFRWIYERSPGYQMPEYVCDNMHDVINPDGTVDLKTD